MKLQLISVFVSFGFLLSGCGRISSATLEKAAARVAERRSASILARDLTRDNASRMSRLPAERRVYRYATESQANLLRKKASRPARTLLLRLGQGAPSAARRRKNGLGCPTRLIAVSVTLPEGTTLKSNKVVGGSRGYGEVRVERGISPNAIRAESVLQPDGK